MKFGFFGYSMRGYGSLLVSQIHSERGSRFSLLEIFHLVKFEHCK